MLTPGSSFKENLQALPSIDGIERIDLLDQSGAVVGTIENQPGRQGSLAVYNYLKIAFGTLDAAAAHYALVLFAEHTPDARNRPGAHPNVDRLIAIAEGGEILNLVVIPKNSAGS